MIALDTNALLRFMLRDDEPDYQLISPYILQAEPKSCLITLLVCMETDWVLESCYKLSKVQRAEFFNTIMSVKQFVFEEMETLKRTVLNFQQRNAEFSDVLIAAQAKTLGAEKTLSFDRGARSAGRSCLLDA